MVEGHGVAFLVDSPVNIERGVERVFGRTGIGIAIGILCVAVLHPVRWFIHHSIIGQTASLEGELVLAFPLGPVGLKIILIFHVIASGVASLSLGVCPCTIPLDIVVADRSK